MLWIMHSVPEFDHYQRLAVGGTVCISQCGSCYDTNCLMQNLLCNSFGFKIILSFNSRLKFNRRFLGSKTRTHSLDPYLWGKLFRLCLGVELILHIFCYLPEFAGSLTHYLSNEKSEKNIRIVGFNASTCVSTCTWH